MELWQSSKQLLHVLIVSVSTCCTSHWSEHILNTALQLGFCTKCAPSSTNAYTQQLHHTCQNCVYQSPPALDVISCVQQHGDLLVPRTSTSTHGPRSFAVSGLSVWNKLPATLRVSPTFGQFQSKLKAVLFRSAYET